MYQYQQHSVSQVFIKDYELIDTISFVLDPNDIDISFNFQIYDYVVDYHLVFTHTSIDSQRAQISVSVEDVTDIDGIENQQRGLIVLSNIPKGEFGTKKRIKIYRLPDSLGDVEMSLFINSNPINDEKFIRFVNISLWHRRGTKNENA